MIKNDVHVKIAEVKTGHPEERLRAVLGSCIGIAFLWKQKKLYGLAHCLLPERDIPSSQISAKYISDAVPSLMTLMKIKKEDIKAIEVHIAGGANVVSHLSGRKNEDIGSLNIASVRKVLKAHGFKIKSENVGGFLGRQIFIDCSTENVSVEFIENPKALAG